MESRKRMREYGLTPGRLSPGKYNAVTDVPGVKVGQVTLIRGEGPLQPGEGPVRTGVTVLKPHGGNIFQEKVTAACHVINGYGKSIGLPQIRELGRIETPIILTSTLSVGRAADGLIEYMLEDNPDIGIETGTINPVVCECNDGYLNDIQGRHVDKECVIRALRTATMGQVAEGTVGAGTGMSSFGFKGGIGTASRRVKIEDEIFHLGTLVLNNFGDLPDLMIEGVTVGQRLMAEGLPGNHSPTGNDGSVIVILATDLPLSSRQLGRLARRVPAGLGRVGSIIAHGSGDFVLAFSTACQHQHQPMSPFSTRRLLNEDYGIINELFLGVVEATAEAVLNSLFAAVTVVGRDDHRRQALPVNRVLEMLTK